MNIIKLFSFSFFLLFSFSLRAQNIDGINFQYGEWLVQAKEIDLLELDTLTLINIKNYEADKQEAVNGEIQYYYPHKDFTISTLSFQENGQLIVNEYSINCCGNRERWKWRINRNDLTMNIDVVRKIKNKYKIVSINESVEKWETKNTNKEPIKFKAEIIKIILAKI